MLDFLGDIAKGVGKITGTILGTVIGVSVTVVAETLGITVKMVESAKEAGCETYEEIRDFHNL